MRLQRIVSRKVGAKTYYKWQFTLPPEVVERLGWQAGDDLAVETRGPFLTVHKADH